MKKAAILILFCAAMVPAALVAQTADGPSETQAPRVIKTKWVLKQPKRVKEAKPKMPGPSVPPAASVRLPKSQTAQRAKAPPRKQRPNNAPIVSALAQSKRKNN